MISLAARARSFGSSESRRSAWTDRALSMRVLHAVPSEVGDGVSLSIILFAERGIVHPTVDGRAVHANELGGLAGRFGGDQMGDCELLSFGEFFFGICCILLTSCCISLVIVKLCGGWPLVVRIGHVFLFVKLGVGWGIEQVQGNSIRQILLYAGTGSIVPLRIDETIPKTLRWP